MMEIAGIKMDEYKVRRNDCRGCVDKIFEILSEAALKQFS